MASFSRMPTARRVFQMVIEGCICDFLSMFWKCDLGLVSAPLSPWRLFFVWFEMSGVDNVGRRSAHNWPHMFSKCLPSRRSHARARGGHTAVLYYWRHTKLLYISNRGSRGEKRGDRRVYLFIAFNLAGGSDGRADRDECRVLKQAVVVTWRVDKMLLWDFLSWGSGSHSPLVVYNIKKVLRSCASRSLLLFG